ncbi:MAG: hypothetical protein ABSC94_20820 [Polyangiaceae bacterium]|jgi:hypothetical protein
MDARLRTALRAVAFTGVGLTAAAALFGSPSSALGTLLGAAVAAANLWTLARIVVALLPVDATGSAAQSRAGWAIVAALKGGGLLGLTWLLMRHGAVAPLPLLFGFLSLPIGIAIGSLVSDRSAASRDR